MRVPVRVSDHRPGRAIGRALLLALVLVPALAAPARADTVVTHHDWSCDVPYSGELSCTPPLAVPPGGYLWIGEPTGGPTVFRVYRGTGGARTQIGWTELRHGEGRAYTNTTDTLVVVEVTVHEDAPTDRCGAQSEHGFVEVRRAPSGPGIFRSDRV